VNPINIRKLQLSVMSFSSMIEELQKELRSNLPQIRFLLKKNPAMAFTTLNEIATSIGKKYNIRLSLNFPERNKIEDFQSYGTENIGIVFQRNSKEFPIPREMIKSKATEILSKAQVEEAYMYEGKEGLRVLVDDIRLDILPASLHVWGKFDKPVMDFCDWLLPNCYEIRPGVDVASSETNS
jgi:hypothetical protein